MTTVSFLSVFWCQEIDNVFRANSYVFLCNKSKSILNDQFTEAAIFRIFCSCHRSSRPGVFFKVSQNLQENTCVTVSIFFNKVTGYLLKSGSEKRVIVNFGKFLRTSFLYKTPLVAASDVRINPIGMLHVVRF